MRVGVKIRQNPEKFFENYDDAMDYIENFIPEIETMALSPDDILINYYESTA